MIYVLDSLAGMTRKSLIITKKMGMMNKMRMTKKVLIINGSISHKKCDDS